MSDTSDDLPPPHPGGVSPARNIDTRTYIVLKPLRVPIEVGQRFSAWAQGETFAHVSGLGLGVVTNGEIEDWELSGRIRRESAPESALGGSQMASRENPSHEGVGKDTPSSGH